ncbi:MAG TPA: glycosyltransferase family 1 protein [Ktedonobacterales bacterium]|nr:glycosyltransferase family 1 protein [Ktedonobacterales bacterium]
MAQIEVAINAQLVSFGQTYRNAGVSRYTAMLLEGLNALGDESADMRFTAFMSKAEADAAQTDAIRQTERVRLASSRWPTNHPTQRILWEQLALPGMLRRMDAQVFHAPVNILPLRLPCASVVTVHDLAFLRYPQYFRPARRLYQRFFTRQSVRAASRIVAVSASTRNDLIDLLGVDPGRVQVIYPCIADDFRPISDPATLATFRATHNLPESYILFLGTLEPRKHLETLAQAYAVARAMESDLPPLVIAGAKGWYYQPLFERTRALGVADQVRFVGYVARDEQPLWYAAASLFVYPSVYEGFGLPVVEALACGTPTITTNVSSLPEAGGSLALQVHPGDGNELAYVMREAWRDTALHQRVLLEGPRWARQFSPREMARQYVGVYRAVAG